MDKVVELCETDIDYDLFEITDDDEIIRMNEEDTNKLIEKLKKQKKEEVEFEIEPPLEMEDILADFEVVEE